MRRNTSMIAAAILVLSSAFVPSRPSAVAGETTRAATGGIQWFATWEQAKAEARRTQRPILLIAAAPHCRNVSGMW